VCSVNQEVFNHQPLNVVSKTLAAGPVGYEKIHSGNQLLIKAILG